MNGWQISCYALAVVVVYFFEQDLYAAVILISHWILEAVGKPIMASFGSALHTMGSGKGYCSSLGECLGELFGAIILAVVYFVLGLALVALLIGVAVTVGWPGVAAEWLVRSGGPWLYVGDAVFVWLIGSFFYGVLFPVLWVAVAPVLAATVGEVVYRRARQRVFGEVARFHEPLYLAVGLFLLAMVVLRLCAPGVQASQVAWKKTVDQVLHPTEPPYPKIFHARPGEIVRTGIRVATGLEVRAATTAHVKIGYGYTPGQPTTTFRRSAGDTGSRCFVGTPVGDRPCGSMIWPFYTEGELTFMGGDEEATITVFEEPQYVGRQWLLTVGQTIRPGEWLDGGDSFWYIASEGLSFRVDGAGSSSPWRPLTPHGPPTGKGSEKIPTGFAGHLEIRADKIPTWFNFIDQRREMWHYVVAAERVVDTGIRVRQGDSFAVYPDQSDPVYVLHPVRTPEIVKKDAPRAWSVDYEGTIKLKGGLANSGASVRIQSRGSRWK